MTFDFPAFLVLASALSGGIWLIDALLFAPRRRRSDDAALLKGANDQLLSREPTIVEYARSFFPVIFAVLILRSFLVEPFRIPSNSMMPTLLTGDFILVNKFSYGLRLPVLNYKIVEIGNPQRGDVVVFKYPENPKIDYIKRVVGLPGDEINYRNKTIYVNGEAVSQLPMGNFNGEGSGIEMTGANELLEHLGDVNHAILTRNEAPNLPLGCQKLALGSILVPPNHYFVMGDNRDNSNDSRCWGFVPADHFVGKAFAIWMHWDMARNGLPILWSRLGNGIQ
ncbi:signal peptidase I [Chromatium weissei]|nr:signal peptidase I [Chromatium weissei]